MTNENLKMKLTEYAFYQSSIDRVCIYDQCFQEPQIGSKKYKIAFLHCYHLDLNISYFYCNT